MHFLIPIFGYSVLLFIDGSLNQTYHLALLRCIAGFTLGMTTYNLWLALDETKRIWLYHLQVMFVLGIVITLHIGPSDIFSILFFFLLVLSTADDKGVIANILCKKPLVHLGIISYSIYMTHFVILHFFYQYKWFFFDYWVSNGLIDKQVLTISLAFIFVSVVLIFSEATYRFIEVPARQFISNYRNRNW